jgi:hypothetical protein
MRASDGGYYVVKFQNNPQHLRVLANEMFAFQLGQKLGVPMPQVAGIEVSEWLIENTPELRIDLPGRSVRCSAGVQLGVQYVTDPLHGQVYDYMPESMMPRISNVGDFARVLVLDKWAGNCDGRQAVFSRGQGARKYRASFIDHGYCFNCHEWNFPDLTLHGVYYRNFVYRQVTGWESFQPALSRAERMSWFDLWHCASEIPAAWYEKDREGLRRIVEALYERRSLIRTLIEAFRDSSRNPFPNWKISSVQLGTETPPAPPNLIPQVQSVAVCHG